MAATPFEIFCPSNISATACAGLPPRWRRPCAGPGFNIPHRGYWYTRCLLRPRPRGSYRRRRWWWWTPTSAPRPSASVWPDSAPAHARDGHRYPGAVGISRADPAEHHVGAAPRAIPLQWMARSTSTRPGTTDHQNAVMRVWRPSRGCRRSRSRRHAGSRRWWLGRRCGRFNAGPAGPVAVVAHQQVLALSTCGGVRDQAEP